MLHCFITAPNRIILNKFGITNFYMNFFINIIVSTALPIVFAIICKKIKIYDYIFRPAKRLKIKEGNNK